MSISRFILPSLALLLCLRATAQNGTAEGYVNDATGKGVLNALVAFDQPDTKYHTETKTDKSGHFIFLSLLRGEYRVTVKVDGKVRDTRENYLVSAGGQNGSGEMRFLVFKLKPIEEFNAAQEKEALKSMSKEDAAKLKSAREDQIVKLRALNTNYAAATTAMEAKEYDAAIDYLVKAAAADPKQPAIWNLLANASIAAARQHPSAEAPPLYQKAYEAFGKLIEIEPENAGNYNNFALALAANGKLDDAAQKLAKAIELDPQNAGTYHYNLAALLMNSSHVDEAIEEFRKAAVAKPDFADAYYHLGSTLAGKAAPDAAGKITVPAGTLEALNKYLSLKPDGPFAQAAKDLLNALGAKPATVK